MTTHLRAAAALALSALALGACGGEARPTGDGGLLVNQQSGASLPALNPDPAANTFAPALGVDLTKFTKRPSGLYVRDDRVGTGAEAAGGKRVSVKYRGTLASGKEFDAGTYDFVLGQGQVIQAWDEGVVGMRVGAVRTIVVPAALGYGTTGAGVDIPPNAVLVFRMELVRMQ